MCVQPNGAAKPIVVVDVPNHLPKPDVEAVVRHAMLAKSAAGAADAPLVAKKLHWTMPSWQVSGPANHAPHGGVQQAIVYSMKEYASARASWRKGKVPPPPPPQPAPKKPPAKWGGLTSESLQQHAEDLSTLD